MKLSEIILERQKVGDVELHKGFISTKTEEDPETGAETWEIDYITRNAIARSLDDTITSFNRLVEQYKDDDKLKSFQEYLLHFRKVYKSYMSRKYGKV